MITRSRTLSLEARVPAHAQNDDLSVEVPSFEQIFDRDEPLHLFIITCHPGLCSRAEVSWTICPYADLIASLNAELVGSPADSFLPVVA